MRAFVTGGTGFIGSHVVRLLIQKGFEVRVLVRPDSPLDNLNGLAVERVNGSLLDGNLARLIQGCQFVFHIAARYSLWQSERYALYWDNVLGTRNVLAAARQVSVERVVYTSSVAAIGVKPRGEIADETYQSPVADLVGYYKQSKYWAEQEALQAVADGQDVVIVNPASPIGAGDIKPTPTGDIILRFLRGKMPAYVNTGLNFVDVRDVAMGHLLALEKGNVGDRYILGHENLTLKTLLDKLCCITGQRAPQLTLPIWLPLSAACLDECVLARLGKLPSIPLDGVRMAAQPMYYSAEKAVRELGFPQTSVDNALQEAVDWFWGRGYVNAR